MLAANLPIIFSACFVFCVRDWSTCGAVPKRSEGMNRARRRSAKSPTRAKRGERPNKKNCPIRFHRAVQFFQASTDSAL